MLEKIWMVIGYNWLTVQRGHLVYNFMILNRYVISQNKILRGWKHLPFALQDLATGQAEFFGKEDYLL